MGLVAIVIAAAFLWDGWSLPPGAFEPIGAGPVPRAVAWMVIALALAMMGEAGWRRTQGAPQAAALAYQPRPVVALIVMAGTIIYVATMALGWIGFAPATVVYLTAMIWLLADFRRNVLPVALVIALIMGYGLRYLFTRVLITDLP